MSKKILISCLTLEDGNITPLLLKTKEWQSLGNEITFFGNHKLKSRIDSSGILSDYKFIELEKTKISSNKISFMLESLRRNFLARRYVNRLKNKYDLVYSISSVLDMIIFPYFLKRNDKKIKWGVVFDNTVSLSQETSFLVKLLAWFFFRFSLFFLKKADRIFAISDELKTYLINRGFKNDQIVVTGNAVEVEEIKRAQFVEKNESDIVFVGRINPAKGIYDMLKVLNIIKKNKPDIQLVIVGAGDKKEEQKFKNKIVSMGLEPNIQLLGFRSGVEKFNIIKSSKCFLFLSSGESFGVALLEAVCCGLHAFTYDLPVFSKIYQNGEIFVSKKGDFRTVAEKMIIFLDKGEFKNQAEGLLLGNYTWSGIAKKEIVSL